MILATQYYRPPFPDRRHWTHDFQQIKASGLGAVMVSAVWAWCEATPGTFDFSDLDDLVSEAEKNDLGVIVNTWAEVQPSWIHRLVPGSEMVNQRGERVLSTPLAYTHHGLVPGGCTDHPEIRSRAQAFLAALGQRYAGQVNVWDCWNEIRWMTQADGYVCHCSHTVQRFRSWLEAQYGDLDTLNRQWRRRYDSWDDVQLGSVPARGTLDAMVFQDFLAHRARHDLAWRRDCLRSADPGAPIVAHSAVPTPYNTGQTFEFESPVSRGDDWELANEVDSWGSSYFPAWFDFSPLDLGGQLEATRGAAGGGFWVSELQGGGARHGLGPMPAVAGTEQARWIWNAVARGAKHVTFWCWRDEVFGREGGGFGLAGDDGEAAGRLAEIARLTTALRTQEEFFDAWTPLQERVAVVFQPDSYRLAWANVPGPSLDGRAGAASARAALALQGYVRGLEKCQIPYQLIAPGRTTNLDEFDVVVMPWPLVVEASFAELLASYVRRGGTVLVEPDFDAFDSLGFFHYPAERKLAEHWGIVSLGQRVSADGELTYRLDGAVGRLSLQGWFEPAQVVGAETIADDPLFTVVRSGEGRVVRLGGFAGLAYVDDPSSDFELFLSRLTDGSSRVRRDTCSVPDGTRIQWRVGESSQDYGLMIISHDHAGEIVFTLPSLRDRDVTSGYDVFGRATVDVRREDGDLRVAVTMAAGDICGIVFTA